MKKRLVTGLAVSLPLALRSGKQGSSQAVADLFNFNTQHLSIEEQNTLIGLNSSNKKVNKASNVNNVTFNSGRNMPVSGTMNQSML